MPTPIEQLLSRTVYNTNGTTTVWDFSFASGYLDPSHVKAYTTDSLGVQTDIVVTAPMLIGEFQLQITPALADGLVLTIYRDTPKDAPLVNFTDESSFSEIALDTNAKQAVMVAAEAIDTVNSSDIQGAIDAAQSAATASAVASAAASNAAASAIAAATFNPVNFATSAQGVKADSALQLTSLTGAATKATPVDADQFTFLDSAASFVLKKLTWANIKSGLSSLFALRGANSDITSLSAVTSINGGPLAGLRNRIINGAMTVNQRGSTSIALTSSPVYLTDRWSVQTDVAASGTVQAILQSTGSDVTRLALSFLKSAGTYANSFVSAQAIETANCSDLAGKTVTLSVKALRGSTFNGQIFAQIRTGTGTDQGLAGAFAGTWTGYASASAISSTSLTTSFVTYSGTITIPAGTREIAVLLFVQNTATAGDANHYVWVSDVQLELGSTATTFEQRPYGMELALCKRYLPFASTGDVASGVTTSTSGGIVLFRFEVEPRVAPTGISVSGIASLTTGTVLSAVSALTFSSAGLTAARLSVTGTGTPYAANQPAILLDAGGLKIQFTGCEL